MEKKYRLFAEQSNWWADNVLSIAKLESGFQTIAGDKGSLTAALMAMSGGNFSVNVLRQKIAIPLYHEQKKLGHRMSQAAMIREVELQLYGQSVVYARSIIPLPLINKGRNNLVKLGRTPLGHFLFKGGKIRVSKRQFTQFTHHKINYVARRTPYDYDGSQILVSEFFLPQITSYLP